MRYGSKPVRQQMESISMYLKSEGFTIGVTHTGFVAVDAEGVVIQCSPFRTSAQIQHPIHKRFKEEYSRKLPSAQWFTERMDMLIKWANDPKSKEPSRIVKMSRKPVPSRAAILASICPPSTPMTISSNTSAQPLRGKA